MLIKNLNPGLKILDLEKIKFTQEFLNRSTLNSICLNKQKILIIFMSL